MGKLTKTNSKTKKTSSTSKNSQTQTSFSSSLEELANTNFTTGYQACLKDILSTLTNLAKGITNGNRKSKQTK